MLTIQEQEKMRRLMQLLDPEEAQSSSKRKTRTQVDVSERKRDERGRFSTDSVMEGSPSELDEVRPIKLVRVKGSYNSYLVTRQFLSNTEKDIMAAVCVLIVLALIF